MDKDRTYQLGHTYELDCAPDERWTERLVTDRLSDVIDPLPGALDPDPDRCPRCGSASIEGGGFDVDAPLAWQECRCDECGHEWRDVYRIAAQESDED